MTAFLVTPAMMRAELALAEGARKARRRRVRFLSTQYSRARDLPRVVSSFADPGSRYPFAQLREGCRNDLPQTTKSIMADLMFRLRCAMKAATAGERPFGSDPQARIDALRIALYGEARRYAQQRMREALAPQAAE